MKRNAHSGKHRAREDHGEPANLADRHGDHVPHHQPARHRPLAEPVRDGELVVGVAQDPVEDVGRVGAGE